MGDSQERPLTAEEVVEIAERLAGGRARREERAARYARKTHEEALASPATTSTMAAAVPAPDLLPSPSENGNLLLPNPTGSPPQELSSSEKLNEEHEVNNVVVPPKSAMATMDRVLDVIKSTMTCADIVTILEKHGCHDLTSSLDEPACSRYPIANGGLGDVFDGRLLNGTSVAIKTIRAYYDKGQLTRIYHKRAAREIYTWSKCKHPNVIELMGIAVFRDCLAMISRWEENGSLLQYLSRHSSADRCQLSTSICAGLTYLHTNDIVHGDLKGANVLIGQDGQPMLMDFGNATLIDATLQFTQTNTGISFSLRWTAPEQLEGTAAHTSAGDIYALGMTILETFTSEVPFADKAEKSLLMYVVVHKNKPTRPESIIPKRSISGDVLWDILTKCWAYDPADRPTAETVWNSMKPLTPDQLKEIED